MVAEARNLVKSKVRSNQSKVQNFSVPLLWRQRKVPPRAQRSRLEALTQTPLRFASRLKSGFPGGHMIAGSAVRAKIFRPYLGRHRGTAPTTCITTQPRSHEPASAAKRWGFKVKGKNRDSSVAVHRSVAGYCEVSEHFIRNDNLFSLGFYVFKNPLQRSRAKRARADFGRHAV